MINLNRAKKSNPTEFDQLFVLHEIVISNLTEVKYHKPWTTRGFHRSLTSRSQNQSRYEKANPDIRFKKKNKTKKTSNGDFSRPTKDDMVDLEKKVIKLMLECLFPFLSVPN